MTTQEWVLTIETEFWTKLREFNIDLEVIETESKDDKFFVEIFDHAIANTEFLNLIDMMKKEYSANLEWIEPSYYSVILVFSPEDKKADSQ